MRKLYWDGQITIQWYLIDILYRKICEKMYTCYLYVNSKWTSNWNPHVIDRNDLTDMYIYQLQKTLIPLTFTSNQFEETKRGLFSQFPTSFCFWHSLIVANHNIFCRCGKKYTVLSLLGVYKSDVLILQERFHFTLLQ